MKLRKTALIFGLLFILAGAASGWAAEGERAYTWADKLKRGLINVVTSPVEVAREIYITTEEKNLLVGWTIGIVKGMAEGFVRFSAGVVDILTSPFNFPDSRRGPLIDPEYVWEKPGPRYV